MSSMGRQRMDPVSSRADHLRIEPLDSANATRTSPPPKSDSPQLPLPALLLNITTILPLHRIDMQMP